MKLVYKVDEIAAYSGLKDYFGDKIYVVVNEDLNELRLYGKNKGYKKERRLLDDTGHKNIYIPEWLEVIDITKSTEEKIHEHFPGYKHKEWQVW